MVVKLQMRTPTSLLIAVLSVLALLSSGHAGEDSLSAHVGRADRISIVKLGDHSFIIDKQGNAVWNIWENAAPSDTDIEAQLSTSEFQKVLSLSVAVLKRNFEPNKAIDNKHTIYEIRFGQYFTSLVLYVSVNESEEVPADLQKLLSYVNQLMQLNNSLNNGRADERRASQLKR